LKITIEKQWAIEIELPLQPNPGLNRKENWKMSKRSVGASGAFLGGVLAF
jgi:hypothetical protein